MTYDIKILELGEAELDHGRIVQTGQAGSRVRIPVYGFLLLGGGEVVLVDTGFREPTILERLGMRGFRSAEQEIEAQLALHGVAPGDVRYVMHTHLHIDHAGQTDRFPGATAVMDRRELEYSVSGLSGPSYPPEDIKHMVDRLHRKGELWLMDLESTGRERVMPGLWCEPAGGHTEGSMTVWIETADGLACLCGDIIYQTDAQIMDNAAILKNDPILSGNTVMTRRSEKASIKRVLNRADIVYPSHDRSFRPDEM